MEELRSFQIRKNPEEIAMQAQAQMMGSFETDARNVPKDAVEKFMHDANLMGEIEKNGWPTDEETCDRIGDRRGMGGIEVAAISIHQMEILAKRKRSGEQVH